jgi:lipopolysaccharide/colanic/teichoic acid biosynthesis glycosyltransferase
MSVEYLRAGAADRPARAEDAPAGGRTYEWITALYGRAIALSAIIGLAPLWLAIAIAIKATSRGPVLFRIPIAGRGGRVFTYLKFRTMVDGGDDGDHQRWIESFVSADQPYTRDADGQPVYKLTNDPRVTTVGRLLRRTSLDEMPQLINVLRGDMNIIGPRPPMLYEYGLYGPRERRRLAVRPGITGMYQVNKRGRASFSEMLELDLEYVRRRSLWLDLKILLRTPRAILHGEVIAR